MNNQDNKDVLQELRSKSKDELLFILVSTMSKLRNEETKLQKLEFGENVQKKSSMDRGKGRLNSELSEILSFAKGGGPKEDIQTNIKNIKDELDILDKVIDDKQKEEKKVDKKNPVPVPRTDFLNNTEYFSIEKIIKTINRVQLYNPEIGKPQRTVLLKPLKGGYKSAFRKSKKRTSPYRRHTRKYR